MAVTAAQATACFANNVSSSFQFPGMRNMSTGGRNGGRVNFNNQTQAEWAWHVAIDVTWNGLNNQQRAYVQVFSFHLKRTNNISTVRAYCAQWGPTAEPHQPNPGSWDFFRYERNNLFYTFISNETIARNSGVLLMVYRVAAPVLSATAVCQQSRMSLSDSTQVLLCLAAAARRRPFLSTS
jgi:hypothetical protein